MTKEVLEQAKTLDGNIETINEALIILSGSRLRITNTSTNFEEFRLDDLDKDTHDELLTAMNDVLTKRKSSMVKELEEL